MHEITSAHLAFLPHAITPGPVPRTDSGATQSVLANRGSVLQTAVFPQSVQAP